MDAMLQVYVSEVVTENVPDIRIVPCGEIALPGGVTGPSNTALQDVPCGGAPGSELVPFATFDRPFGSVVNLTFSEVFAPLTKYEVIFNTV